MTLAELVAEYERRMTEAQRHGYTAPAEKVYALVLDDLRALDGVESLDRAMATAEAARMLGVAPKTVRAWCGDGRFPGAWRTNGDTGEWRIPVREVQGETGAAVPDRTRSPKLWIPTKGGQH